MKKIIIGLLCMTLGMSLNACAQSFAFTMTGNGDTIIDTGTKTNTLKLTEPYQTVSIHVVITKISGTVAGTVTIQGSNDGTNWVTHDTTYVGLGLVTFSPTNVATQSKVFITNRNPYLWYRISYTGAGTMSASMRSYLVGRK